MYNRELADLAKKTNDLDNTFQKTGSTHADKSQKQQTSNFSLGINQPSTNSTIEITGTSFDIDREQILALESVASLTQQQQEHQRTITDSVSLRSSLEVGPTITDRFGNTSMSSTMDLINDVRMRRH